MKKIAAGLVLAAVASACSSANSSSGTLPPSRVDVDGPNASVPPPSLPPSGPSMPPPENNGFKGCPATRPASDVSKASPIDPLTEADLLAASGVYRPCTDPDGLELRYDEEAGKLRWYRLDDRFVRIPSWEGTIEDVSCDGAKCTVQWTDTGAPTRTYDLELWRDPIALRRSGDGDVDQEWVRIAD